MFNPKRYWWEKVGNVNYNEHAPSFTSNCSLLVTLHRCSRIESRKFVGYRLWNTL
ncbi:MAG: hypothetical protein RLZZ71_1891 [Bacteroidota bacterium]|jgi:hypothetical protein